MLSWFIVWSQNDVGNQNVKHVQVTEAIPVWIAGHIKDTTQQGPSPGC